MLLTKLHPFLRGLNWIICIVWGVGEEGEVCVKGACVGAHSCQPQIFYREPFQRAPNLDMVGWMSCHIMYITVVVGFLDFVIYCKLWISFAPKLSSARSHWFFLQLWPYAWILVKSRDLFFVCNECFGFNPGSRVILYLQQPKKGEGFWQLVKAWRELT